jgi:hypothetical protein
MYGFAVTFSPHVLGGFAKPSSDFYVPYSTTTAPGCHRNDGQRSGQRKSGAALRPARAVAFRPERSRQEIDTARTLPGKLEIQGRRTAYANLLLFAYGKISISSPA